MRAKGFREISRRSRSHEVPDELEIDHGVLWPMRREARGSREVGELVQDDPFPPRPARKRDRALVLQRTGVPAPAAVPHLNLVERGEASFPPRRSQDPVDLRLAMGNTRKVMARADGAFGPVELRALAVSWPPFADQCRGVGARARPKQGDSPV